MGYVVVVVKANPVETVLRRAVIGRRDKRKGRRRGVNYTAKRSKQMEDTRRQHIEVDSVRVSSIE